MIILQAQRQINDTERVFNLASPFPRLSKHDNKALVLIFPYNGTIPYNAPSPRTLITTTLACPKFRICRVVPRPKHEAHLHEPLSRTFLLPLKLDQSIILTFSILLCYAIPLPILLSRSNDLKINGVGIEMEIKKKKKKNAFEFNITDDSVTNRY